MNPFKIPFLERKESEIDRYEDERRKNEEREIERNSGSNSQRGIERELRPARIELATFRFGAERSIH